MLSALKKFHKNEEGMEAIQVAMIIAAGAVIILLIWSQWTTIKGWFTTTTTGQGGVTDTIK